MPAVMDALKHGHGLNDLRVSDGSVSILTRCHCIARGLAQIFVNTPLIENGDKELQNKTANSKPADKRIDDKEQNKCNECERGIKE